MKAAGMGGLTGSSHSMRDSNHLEQGSAEASNSLEQGSAECREPQVTWSKKQGVSDGQHV